MGTKIKGIYKGFKYISQIFGNGSIVVVKDHEMEIGYPTDVKHVAHIGWDGSGSEKPSWMNGFNMRPGLAATSVVSSGATSSQWSSQDIGETLGRQQASNMFKDVPPTDIHNIRKKSRRKKQRSNSSPKLCSSTRSSRAAKTRVKLIEGNANTANIEVA